MTKSPTPMAITPLSKASIAGGRYTSPLSNIDAIKYKQLKITTIIPNMCKKRPTNKYHPTFHCELKLSEDGLGSNIKLNRSEERRVGKECRSQRWRWQLKNIAQRGRGEREI